MCPVRDLPHGSRVHIQPVEVRNKLGSAGVHPRLGHGGEVDRPAVACRGEGNPVIDHRVQDLLPPGCRVESDDRGELVRGRPIDVQPPVRHHGMHPAGGPPRRDERAPRQGTRRRVPFSHVRFQVVEHLCGAASGHLLDRRPGAEEWKAEILVHDPSKCVCTVGPQEIVDEGVAGNVDAVGRRKCGAVRALLEAEQPPLLDRGLVGHLEEGVSSPASLGEECFRVRARTLDHPAGKEGELGRREVCAEKSGKREKEATVHRGMHEVRELVGEEDLQPALGPRSQEMVGRRGEIQLDALRQE